MSISQTDNFIAILRTACGNGQQELHTPDWDELIRMAQIHTVTALFYMGAVCYPEFAACSARQQRQLQADTITVVGRQAQRTQLFLQLYQSLIDGGLHPLVLKGIVCRNLYGKLADYRPSCDEDLYLPPEQVEPCRCILEQNGWHLTSHESSMDVKEQLQEIAFDDDVHLLHIELHPTLFGTERADQRRCNAWFAGLEQRAVSIAIGGSEIYTLGYTDHYLYLFLHLVKHFANTGVGIRQVMDMMQFARAYGTQIDWLKMEQAIRKLSSPGLYADVVAVGCQLGFTAKRLFPTVHPEQLLADSLAGGVYGHDREGNGRGTVLSVAAQYPTRWERVRRLLFPSTKQLLAGRPWLEKRPWLLPVAWVQRVGRLFRGDGRWSRVTGKSLAVAYQRLNLLRDYDLLPGSRRKQRKMRVALTTPTPPFRAGPPGRTKGNQDPKEVPP